MKASDVRAGGVTWDGFLPSCARAKGSVGSGAPLPLGVLLPLQKPAMDCTWAG